MISRIYFVINRVEFIIVKQQKRIPENLKYNIYAKKGIRYTKNRIRTSRVV